MKKTLAILVVLIIGMASLSIVSSGTAASLCFPPSTCQQCTHGYCACRNIPNFCWCHDYCSQSCNGQLGEGCLVFENDGPRLVTLNQECQACLDNCCEVESFQYCQQQWFHPYWMEIYDDSVKGCYAKDLLCFNAPVEAGLGPDCYLDGKPDTISYPYPYEKSENGNKMVLTIPSCSNSRTFFQTPPPCGIFEGDLSVTDKINGNGLILNGGCCFDMRGCTTNTIDCAKPCATYDLPSNYNCNINEIVIMGIQSIYGEVLINGRSYSFSECSGPECQRMIVWYNGEKPFSAVPGLVYVNQGVPRSINIEGNGEIIFSLEQKCCYDCKQKPSLPAILLYPKVDIETLSIAGGPTVIKDGKIISSLMISPGIQQAMVQVENRGFFTQNDSRIRFEGLPEGITVSTQPDTQKITAHNIATYSAIFTVGPNVPSGTYKVTLAAYSQKGVFDTITIDFVVP
jgi:hypothetical protein